MRGVCALPQRARATLRCGSCENGRRCARGGARGAGRTLPTAFIFTALCLLLQNRFTAPPRSRAYHYYIYPLFLVYRRYARQHFTFVILLPFAWV